MTGNFLMDTHVLVWALSNDQRLGQVHKDIIADPSLGVFVSAASIWEIAIKRNLGKLDIGGDIFEGIEKANFEPILINFEHAHLAGSLPRHHSDPFDRMLIAQAMIEKFAIMSHDGHFRQYQIEVV